MLAEQTSAMPANNSARVECDLAQQAGWNSRVLRESSAAAAGQAARRTARRESGWPRR
jgi:hypothetical protein